MNIDLIDRCKSFCRKTARFNIEGLQSLEIMHLGTKSAKVDFSIRNLHSMNFLGLSLGYTIDQSILTKLLDQLQHIETLFLRGDISYLNLDDLFNLKDIYLVGTLNTNFNFELFRNLSKQLEYLMISLTNIDEKTFSKLFDGFNFPYLIDFELGKFNMKRLNKEFLKHFPMLIRLCITDCNIEIIEQDSFSNLKNLNDLALINNALEFIEKNSFSNLKNLQTVKFSNNKIKNLEPEFIGLGNSVKITY